MTSFAALFGEAAAFAPLGSPGSAVARSAWSTVGMVPRRVAGGVLESDVISCTDVSRVCGPTGVLSVTSAVGVSPVIFAAVLSGWAITWADAELACLIILRDSSVVSKLADVDWGG